MNRNLGRVGLVVAAVLTLATTGCEKTADQPEVATAVTAGAQPSASASSAGVIAAYVEAQRKWVGCLRKQGFQVPDPDAKGLVDLRYPGAPKKADQTWIRALQACAEFSVPIPEELLEKQAPLSPQQLDGLRDFARCMRENGFPEYPDPAPDGFSNFQGYSPQQEAAGFRAEQICAPVRDGKPRTTPNPHLTAQG